MLDVTHQLVHRRTRIFLCQACCIRLLAWITRVILNLIVWFRLLAQNWYALSGSGLL